MDAEAPQFYVHSPDGELVPGTDEFRHEPFSFVWVPGAGGPGAGASVCVTPGHEDMLPRYYIRHEKSVMGFRPQLQHPTPGGSSKTAPGAGGRLPPLTKEFERILKSCGPALGSVGADEFAVPMTVLGDGPMGDEWSQLEDIQMLIRCAEAFPDHSLSFRQWRPQGGRRGTPDSRNPLLKRLFDDFKQLHFDADCAAAVRDPDDFELWYVYGARIPTE
jgi:hypothetical protein